MALSSTGDVLLLAVLLGVAAADVAVGTAAVLGALAVLGRFGTTSLAALAGAQHVVGPAGTTGPVALAGAMWCAALAVVLGSRGELLVSVAFGLSAANVVAGPSVHGADALAIRMASSLLAVTVAWYVGGWVPPRLARASALLAGALAILLVLLGGR
jgi:hypothetical protein